METEIAVPALAYASPGRRLFAALVDQFAVSFIASPFVWSPLQQALEDDKALSAGQSARVFATLLIALVGYSTAFHAWRGSTLGKMAARIVVLNDDGSRVQLPTAFVRAVALGVGYAISVITSIPLVLVDMVWPFWQRRRQTLHDMVARTVVVRADSLDEKVDEAAPTD